MKSSGVLLGAIVDDFTGATDLVSILARSGQPVSLRIGVPPDPPADPSPYGYFTRRGDTHAIALKSGNFGGSPR